MNRRDGYVAVMGEQKFQKREGSNNPHEIANLYHDASRYAREDAIRLARQDARIARQYQGMKRKRVRRSPNPTKGRKRPMQGRGASSTKKKPLTNDKREQMREFKKKNGRSIRKKGNNTKQMSDKHPKRKVKTSGDFAPGNSFSTAVTLDSTNRSIDSTF